MKNTMIVLNVLLLGFILWSSGQKGAPIFGGAEVDEDGLELLLGDPGAIEPDLPTLYIFFHSDGDCACLDDWPNWREYVLRYGDRLNVKGVFNGQDLERMVGFAGGVDLPFPIYRDPNGHFRHQMRVQSNTVVKVLVDVHDQIQFVDTYQISERDRRHFLKRLNDHLKRI